MQDDCENDSPPRFDRVIKNLNIKKLTDILIDWYQKNKEEYFFRKKRDPYFVWISEIALQQTRIEYASKKIEFFIKKYPDLKKLSEAKEEDVLKNFSGLGYYSRARNIHKAAKIIQKKYSGKFPEDFQELLCLPSIGEYTASAIMSLAFKKKHAAVDANLSRLVYRIFYLKKDNTALNKKENRRLAQDFFLGMMEFHEHPGDVNEAAMELGQKICIPANPACDQCPIGAFCLAYKNADVSIVRKEKLQKKKILWIFINLFSKKDETVEFLLQKNAPPFIFLIGHVFPVSVAIDDQNNDKYYSSQKAKEIIDYYDLHRRIEEIQRLYNTEGLKPEFRHSITNHKIAAFIIHHKVKQNEAIRWKDADNGFIISEDPSSYIVSSASAKVFQTAKR